LTDQDVLTYRYAPEMYFLYNIARVCDIHILMSLWLSTNNHPSILQQPSMQKNLERQLFVSPFVHRGKRKFKWTHAWTQGFFKAKPGHHHAVCTYQVHPHTSPKLFHMQNVSPDYMPKVTSQAESLTMSILIIKGYEVEVRLIT